MVKVDVARNEGRGTFHVAVVFIKCAIGRRRRVRIRIETLVKSQEPLGATSKGKGGEDGE